MGILFSLILRGFCNKVDEAKDISRKIDDAILAELHNEPDEIELRQRKDVINRHLKTKSTLEFEDSMKYWNTQIAGKTKL